MSWIARDKDGKLFGYEVKPIKGPAIWYSFKGKSFQIPDSFYTEVKWEDKEPKQLIIK